MGTAKSERHAKVPHDLMTVREVAKYLRVKPSTIYEWAKDGKIPAAKVGRLWRFHREEIDAWVRSGGGNPKEQQRGKAGR